jgi:hypothetical protein
MNAARLSAGLALLAVGLGLVGFGGTAAVRAWQAADPPQQDGRDILPDLSSVFAFIAADLRRTFQGDHPPQRLAAHSQQDLARPDADHVFLVVYAEDRGPDGHGRLRGSNGPIHVFESRAGGWVAVGGFAGNGLDIIRRGEDLVAQEHWHSSAAAEAPNEFIYRDGGFANWDTTHQ